MFQDHKTISTWLLIVSGLLLVVVVILACLALSPTPPSYHWSHHKLNLNKFYRPLNYSALPIPKITAKNSSTTTLGLKDIAKLKTWMTFDYVNKAFNLPANYLKDALLIKNAHYPLLTIKNYAKLERANSTSTLALVQKALTDYLQQH
jgi:hypothetical protein